MTTTLNEQYAVTCKGWIDNRGVPDEMPWGRPDNCWYNELPDYLTSDAELGAMIRALAEYGEIGFHKNASKGFTLWHDCEKSGNNEFDEVTLNEAAARACIALKLRVEGEV